MALPSSGNPISFSQMRSEYGGGSGSISMSQIYKRSSQQSGNPYFVKDAVYHPARLVLQDGSAYFSSRSESTNYCRNHTFFTTTLGGPPAPAPNNFRSYSFIWNGSTIYAPDPYYGDPNVHLAYDAGGGVTYQIYPCSTGYTFSNSNKGNPTFSAPESGLNAASFDDITGVLTGGFPIPYRTNYTELCKTKWYEGYTDNPNNNVPTSGTIKLSQFADGANPRRYPNWTDYYGKYISNNNGYAYNVPATW